MQRNWQKCRMFNAGSPWNQAAGESSANLKQLEEHYRRVQAEVEEERIARLKQTKGKSVYEWKSFELVTKVASDVVQGILSQRHLASKEHKTIVYTRAASGHCNSRLFDDYRNTGHEHGFLVNIQSTKWYVLHFHYICTGQRLKMKKLWTDKTCN